MPPQVTDFSQLLKHETLQQIRARGVRPGYYINLPPLNRLPRFYLRFPNKVERILYCPTFKQQEFHASTKPNCIMEGGRGSGKSTAIRHDAHMRSLSSEEFTYLILRRTNPELIKSHLKFIDSDMHLLGGSYHRTNKIATYPNRSQGFYSHCEQRVDVEKLLSSEFGAIYFDEITTFPYDMVTEISACARVPEGSGLTAVIRGGTNPIGVGAREVKQYYIDKEVPDDFDYDSSEYQAVRANLEDNPFIDRSQYLKRLKGVVNEHVRRAWIEGIWLAEGAYFTDYYPTRDGNPWHVIPELPQVRDMPLLDCKWLSIYRCLDWGYSPDPAVCIWVAVLPDGREIAFKERHWRNTLAADVAKAIVKESQGMRIVETSADPSMFVTGRGVSTYSIGDIIEQNGVPLTQSINDRMLFGYSVHDHLNTMIDGFPKLQILDGKPNGRLGCPELIRTLADVRTDPRDQRKLADGNDHWVVSLAYFCIGSAVPSRDPAVHQIPRWMRPKQSLHRQIYQQA